LPSDTPTPLAQSPDFGSFENHGGASADPRNIQRFIDGVGSPWFRTCPDTGNFLGDTWEEGMRLMAPYAYSCHIKAWNDDPDGQQRRLVTDVRHRHVGVRFGVFF